MKDSQLALHGLAIKKHADAAAVAEITGLDTSAVQSALDAAVTAGRAVNAGGKFMLQPAAQIALRTGYSRDFAPQRADQALQAAYDDFEKINEHLKQLITDWQTMTVGGQKVTNDHSDEDYDAKIIDRLGNLHEKAEALLDRFAKGLPRLATYKRLLTTALERAEDGEIAWVSDAKCMSYHTVWFELHEDLIRVLNRKRIE